MARKRNYENTEITKPVEPVVELTEPVIEEIKEEKPEPAPIYGAVFNCQILRVRKDASTNSDTIKTIPQGTRVEVLSKRTKAGFYQVKVDGVVGYCMKEFISIES